MLQQWIGQDLILLGFSGIVTRHKLVSSVIGRCHGDRGLLNQEGLKDVSSLASVDQLPFLGYSH